MTPEQHAALDLELVRRLRAFVVAGQGIYSGGVKSTKHQWEQFFYHFGRLPDLDTIDDFEDRLAGAHAPSNNAAIEAAHEGAQWRHNGKALRVLAERAERSETWSPDEADRAAGLVRSIFASMLTHVWQSFRGK